MEKEILLVDKKTGQTSFDVIRKLRRILGIRKMGHAGTLDPLASGLMIIGINAGTKKLAEYIGLPKVYRATVHFGTRTDTGDITGKVVEEGVCDIAALHATYKDMLSAMTGALLLPVPIYSAIKRGGEALYKKARRGEDVEAPKKEMEIFWFKDSSVFENTLTFDVHVSSGSYIRSIAEEMGRRIGTPATLAALRRTEIGDFHVEDVDMVI